jgi:hypothetical protein
LRITAKLEAGDFGRELGLLGIFTWMKWGGLALIFLLLVPYFLKSHAYAKLVGLVGLVTFGLAVTAFFNRSLANELMALGTAVMFLLMIVYALTYRQRKRIAL